MAMREAPEQIFCERLELLYTKYAGSRERRIIIALAGTPGSGKSTISTALVRLFNDRNQDQLQVVPMDGFHHPKSVLSTMKGPECPFLRRGAPFTFDAPSFVNLVQALRDGPVTGIDDSEKAFWVPSFDHAVKDPVENNIRISSTQRILLLEGNYLLLDEHPWTLVKDLVDETWFVSVPRDIAKERLIVRHLAAGIEANRESAAMRAEKNDLINADLINQKLLRPDVVVQNI